MPAGSCAARTSGRNTERRPCAIHLSGKNEAIVCIQVGTWLNWKKTPEMNCSTSAIGVTIADAERPFFARLETAMPSRVQDADPSTATQAKVTQSLPDGQVDAVGQRPDGQQDRRRSAP